MPLSENNKIVINQVNFNLYIHFGQTYFNQSTTIVKIIIKICNNNTFV